MSHVHMSEEEKGGLVKGHLDGEVKRKEEEIRGLNEGREGGEK